MSFFMKTPHEITEHIAHQVKLKRLAENLSQKSLSERSGVSFGVIKKFEGTGKISLESLVKIAVVLNAAEDFQGLFKKAPLEMATSLDALMTDTSRKRGRK